MSGRTTLTLANRRHVDLLDINFKIDDLPALSEMIAKEARFNGATPELQYSVGEHSCRGCDVILHSKDIPQALAQLSAAYFLVHDLRESVWKDDTTPKKNAIAERVSLRCGVTADSVLSVFDELEDEHEEALRNATGLPWPPPGSVRKIVKETDKVMFATEWRDLMGLKPADHPDWSPYADVTPLREKIATPCWTWQTAKVGWLRRATQLLPTLQHRAKP